MKEAWGRLHDVLCHMSERLADTEEGKNKEFRDSLMGNALELVDMLKSLNITGDPQLETARRDLSVAIMGVEAKELRKNPDIRKDVKSQVDSILSKFSF
jgi:hypothetical protein